MSNSSGGSNSKSLEAFECLLIGVAGDQALRGAI
jgi:hypothetical protein